MLNEKIYTLKLPRIAFCDLLIACLAAEEVSGAGKWNDLHKAIKKQLNEQDAVFYAINAVENWRRGLLTSEETKEALFDVFVYGEKA